MFLASSSKSVLAPPELPALSRTVLLNQALRRMSALGSSRGIASLLTNAHSRIFFLASPCPWTGKTRKQPKRLLAAEDPESHREAERANVVNKVLR